MKKYLFLILAFIASVLSSAQSPNDTIRLSDDFSIISLSKSSFIHSTVQTSQQFGTFTCNGLLYINGNEALIMDTPPNDLLAEKLLNWIEERFKDITIKGVVVTHFHSDCLGGLKEFHNRNIPSYAHYLTPELLKAKKDSFAIPQRTFTDSMIIPVGNTQVVNYYFGKAHTNDNIASWIPNQKILFGGCMIKALDAGKGNLADATPSEWSKTVNKIKQKLPHIRIVIPGHGNHGGPELLDYTIKMFANN